MHLVVVFIVGAFLAPKFLNVLVPSQRIARGDGKYDVAPQVTIGEAPTLNDGGLEGGLRNGIEDRPSADRSSIDNGKEVPRTEAPRVEAEPAFK